MYVFVTERERVCVVRVGEMCPADEEICLQCVAVCCSVLQCVAVCCIVLQCDAVLSCAWEKCVPRTRKYVSVYMRGRERECVCVWAWVLVCERGGFVCVFV